MEREIEKEEVVSDDNHGIVDDPRPGQQQEDKEAPEGCEDPHGERDPEPDGSCLDDEQKSLEKIEELLEAAPEPLRDILCEALVSKSWSGLLPDPASFGEYPEWVQHKMTDWNDARIIDESKRLDKMTDAAISNIRLESILTFTINAVFAMTAFLAFVITKDPASFGLLSVPGITIAVNLWRSRKSKDQEDASE